jgi:hypothetical protein
MSQTPVPRGFILAAVAIVGSFPSMVSLEESRVLGVGPETEQADLKLERRELRTDNAGEHRELEAIYLGRGLDPDLAMQVAEQLMARDALGAHARDKLAISETLRARPIQVAVMPAAASPLERPCLLLSPPWFRYRTLSTLLPRFHWPGWRDWGRWPRAPAGRAWRRAQYRLRSGVCLRCPSPPALAPFSGQLERTGRRR